MPSTTRQALLQALSAAGGAYISGQQLAGQLGVSRAAVHKAGGPPPPPGRGKAESLNSAPLSQRFPEVLAERFHTLADPRYIRILR